MKPNRDPIARLTRAELIRICQRNDGNGCWTDADMRREFGTVSRAADLRAIVRDWIADQPTEADRDDCLRTFLQWVGR